MLCKKIYNDQVRIKVRAKLSFFWICITKGKKLLVLEISPYFHAKVSLKWYYTGIILYICSQWEMMLQCNVASHWLDAYTKWSLQLWSKNIVHCLDLQNINVLVQERWNSSVLAMELCLSCTNPSIQPICFVTIWAPSHYLKLWCLIVNWNTRNKLHWNLNQNTTISIRKNVFGIMACKMTNHILNP